MLNPSLSLDDVHLGGDPSPCLLQSWRLSRENAMSASLCVVGPSNMPCCNMSSEHVCEFHRDVLFWMAIASMERGAVFNHKHVLFLNLCKSCQFPDSHYLGVGYAAIRKVVMFIVLPN